MAIEKENIPSIFIVMQYNTSNNNEKKKRIFIIQLCFFSYF